MSSMYSTATVHGSHPSLHRRLAAETGPWRPDWATMEIGMGRALGAIRHYARIAWWDGSSIGLHLHGLIGMFDAVEPASHRPYRDERP